MTTAIPIAGGPTVPALSLEDFRPGPADRVPARSAGYDPDRPFLFEGLSPRFATRTVRSGMVPMRDGTLLSTDFHIPLGADGPLPVVLTRTPYGKQNMWPALQALLPEQGFIYAVQDVRGRHESEGCFSACTGQDRADGADMLDWLVAQPLCNGRVGATGTSYTGETSAKLAATCHPALKASLIMYDAAFEGEGVMNGGYVQHGAIMLRMLYAWFRDYVPKLSYGPPAWVDRQAWFRSGLGRAFHTQPVNQPPADRETQLRTLPVFDLLDRTGAAPSDFAEMLRRTDDFTDPYWREMGFLTETDRFAAPALHVSGPQEAGGSGPRLFHLMQRNAITAEARDHQYFLFTPQPHSGHAQASADFHWGARHFGDTRFPYYRMMVDWFGHWLRGDPLPDWPKARFFVAGRNCWESAESFPPPDVDRQTWWLGAGGRLSLTPSSAAGHDQLRYDPGDPTPSEPPGAAQELVGVGYADRAALEGRPDVLVYDSGPLSAPLELVGRVTLDLYVSSSAIDTDFAAILCERRPDGQVVNISHGILRMRHREGLDRKVWLVPGEIVPVTLDLWFVAIELPAGHSLCLHVQSAHFPAFDRNLNTGGSNATGTDWVVAENRVHFGPDTPSALHLPIRPALG